MWIVILVIVLVLIIAGPLLYVGVFYGNHFFTSLPLISYSTIESEEGYWLYNDARYKLCDHDGPNDRVDLSYFVGVNAESPLHVYDGTLEKEDIIGKNHGMYSTFPIYLFAEEDFGDNIIMRKDGYYAIKEGFSLPDPFSLTLTRAFAYTYGTSFFDPPSDFKTITIGGMNESFTLSDIIDKETERENAFQRDPDGYLGFDISGYQTLHFDPIGVYESDGFYYAEFGFVNNSPSYKIKEEFYPALAKALEEGRAS